MTLPISEELLRSQGYRVIAGVDEAGRGPLAGPVVAAACVIPEGVVIDGVNDSKQLTPEKRLKVYQAIVSHPDIDIGIGIVEAAVIDQVNILQATLRAMAMAIVKLRQKPDYVLVDGNRIPEGEMKRVAVVDGDAKIYVIGAASIVAKVVRDEMMIRFHEQWPQYGFKKHKGYGTAEHLAALKEHGRCPIHRESFKPVRDA
jgi:ribonuclease HII